MRKRLLILCLLGMCSQLLFAQRATKLSERNALMVGHGFQTVTTSNALYFNAFDHKDGWQIFRFNGKEISQVSHFNHVIEHHHQVEKKYGGGMVSWMMVFNDVPVFHISGKTMAIGLYRLDGDRIVKLETGFTECTKPFILNDKLHFTEIIFEDEKEYSRIMTVDANWHVTKGKKSLNPKTHNLAQETLVVDDRVFGNAEGQLMEWSEDGFVYIMPDYTHVQTLFKIDSLLYFTALKKGDKDLNLYCLNRNKVVRNMGNIYPGKHMLTVQKPIVEGDQAFFVADPDKKSLVLYKVNAEKVFASGTLTGKNAHRSVQGMDVCKGSVFVDAFGVSGDHFDMVQYDGSTITKRNPDYLSEVRGTVVFQDHLLYIASELGQDAFYTSDPLMPPTVQNDTFTAFDFWQSGAIVGRVKAKDLSGRIKYSIVGGNESKAFEVDYLTGDIKVYNRSSLAGKTKTPFTLVIEVVNPEGASAKAKMLIHVKEGKKMDTKNLYETLMFFPDFKSKGKLTSHSILDGQIVGIYDSDFNMVDEIIVTNKSIVLGQYPAGLYFINAKKDKNYYQKIELH